MQKDKGYVSSSFQFCEMLLKAKSVPRISCLKEDMRYNPQNHEKSNSWLNRECSVNKLLKTWKIFELFEGETSY